MIDGEVKAMIGDTLLVYQAIEHIMKDIAVSAEVSVSRLALEKGVKKRRETVARSTMGNVVEDYLKIFEPFDDQKDLPVDWVYTKVDFSLNGMDIKTWATLIEEVIEDRNWLVHQVVMELVAEAQAVRDNAVVKIRECNARARRVYSEILVHGRMMEDFRQKLAGSLCAMMKGLNAAAQIRAIMNDKKIMKPDTEGWVPMDRLQRLCRERYGDSMRDMCAATGSKSILEYLKKQMEGVEMCEQKTKKGIRQVYRLQA